MQPHLPLVASSKNARQWYARGHFEQISLPWRSTRLPCWRGNRNFFYLFFIGFRLFHCPFMLGQFLAPAFLCLIYVSTVAGVRPRSMVMVGREKQQKRCDDAEKIAVLALKQRILDTGRATDTSNLAPPFSNPKYL